MNNSRLQLIGISKTFQEGRPNSFTALNNIDLDIGLHGFVVFKGPSGSGKTTLLSLIGCMNRPTTGRIWFRGTEVTGLPEKFLTQIRRQYFGFIFQDFRLLPSLNVLENVMLPAWPSRESGGDIRNRASQLIDRLGMTAKALYRPQNLSGGEKQRIAIARALINDPVLLIADEPTAHLDTDLSVEILHIFKSLCLAGKGVLVASHDPLITSASGVDHLYELRDGKIQQEGMGQC